MTREPFSQLGTAPILVVVDVSGMSIVARTTKP
jgi:hypothetical protein